MKAAPWTFLVAIAGIAWLRAESARRSKLVLGAIAMVAMVVYLGGGIYPINKPLNVHEWVHYYLGSKYSHELSYDRLYECIDRADVEDGFGTAVAARSMTDLGTNTIVTTHRALTDPTYCTSHFAPARWHAFRADVRYFRNHIDPAHWATIFTDHGFNATPVWTAPATMLTNLAPASDFQIHLLGLLDPLYLAAMLLMICWAFGRRTLAISVIVLTTFYPAAYNWTGGAFMRWDWIFFVVASVCCLKENRPLIAGSALGYAALLRVFPAALFAGPLLVLSAQCVRRQQLDQRIVRFVQGGALTAAVVIPTSLLVLDGTATYRAFFHNLAKTQRTPFANAVGLSSVLSWRPKHGVATLYRIGASDPLAVWRHAHELAAGNAMVLRMFAVLVLTLGLRRAAWRVPTWASVALGVTLLPAVADLLSYYYVIIVVLALLAHEHDRIGVWLLGLCATSQFVALAPLPHMPTWDDQQFVVISLATVVVFTAIVVHVARSRPQTHPAALRARSTR